MYMYSTCLLLVTRYIICEVFCKSLFVLLLFYCLSFFDLRFLITPLVSAYLSLYLQHSQCLIYYCAQVCLSTGPRWPGGGGIFLPKCFFFTMDLCLCGAILNLNAFCFGAIPDIMIELIVYGSVPQSRQSCQWFSEIKIKLLGALCSGPK